MQLFRKKSHDFFFIFGIIFEGRKNIFLKIMRRIKSVKSNKRENWRFFSDLTNVTECAILMLKQKENEIIINSAYAILKQNKCPPLQKISAYAILQMEKKGPAL